MCRCRRCRRRPSVGWRASERQTGSLHSGRTRAWPRARAPAPCAGTQLVVDSGDLRAVCRGVAHTHTQAQLARFEPTDRAHTFERVARRRRVAQRARLISKRRQVATRTNAASVSCALIASWRTVGACVPEARRHRVQEGPVAPPGGLSLPPPPTPSPLQAQLAAQSGRLAGRQARLHAYECARVRASVHACVLIRAAKAPDEL